MANTARVLPSASREGFAVRIAPEHSSRNVTASVSGDVSGVASPNIVALESVTISPSDRLSAELANRTSIAVYPSGTTGEARAMVDVTMPPSATSTWAISPTASSQSWKTLRKASSYGRSRNASESAVITLPFAMVCAAMTTGCVEIVNRTHCRAANMASPAQTAASSRCNRAFLRRR